MNKILEVMRRDRLYILLLIFVMLMNVIIFTSSAAKTKAKGATSVLKAKKTTEDLFLKREEAERLFSEKKELAALFGLTSLLILAVLLLGIVLDVLLVSLRLSGRTPDISTYKLQPVSWNILDVAKVVILFMFFGYGIVIVESLLLRTFPILKSENFRMVLNSSILDVLTVVFILYFTSGQYSKKLISLGLSFKNFFKNIFYGIVGYIATVPVLAALLILTAVITNLIKYVPEKQPVVELFLKEKDVVFLTYTSAFTSFVGPIFEELFFRGFMYNALKRNIGRLSAMLVTASIFSLLHAHIVGFLPIMVLGLLLAYLYEKTGTLVSSITVHVMHNFSMVLFVFLAKQLRM